MRVCLSIDVERDYRTDDRMTVHGITEGLPGFIDILRSHRIPHDLMVSGEVAPLVPREIVEGHSDLAALGCHGHLHRPGYLGRRSEAEQERDIVRAQRAIVDAFGRSPRHFRSPNFSVDRRTFAVLDRTGFRVDSSILPGRVVRRMRVFPLLDHRRAPQDPYRPDSNDPFRAGSSRLLEVPVTPNPAYPGSPIGLGFLQRFGPKAAVDSVMASKARYVIFLTHSWEMVDWRDERGVAPWVREAAQRDLSRFEEFLAMADAWEFVNLDSILAAETSGASSAQ